MAQKKPIRVPNSRFSCEATAPREAAIHVYGSIGLDWWGDGIDPAAFAKAVDALDVDTIHVRIDSPGGDAFGGIAMANALRRSKAHVVVTVDGLAASAASMIAMGGDELVMGRNSMLMIHDASGVCLGNAADMTETAGILSKLSDSYADAYAEKAGSDRESMRALMLAETWLTAQEAVDVSLADRVDEKATTSATASFDLRGFYARAPIAAKSAPPVPPGSSPEAIPTREESQMSDTLKAALRERLGITAEVDEAGMIAALDEALTEQAEPKVEAPIAAATIPEGTALIEESVLADLQAKAQRADEAEKAATVARRDQIIADAKREGRITPATEANFRALLDKDEDGTAALIASLQSVVNLTEQGDAREAVESAETAAYAAIYTTKES